MLYALLLVYTYLIIGLVMMLLNKNLPSYYIGLLVFFTIKWVINYRKCTISYLECKIRGVKREEGYLNRLMDDILDIRKEKDIYLILAIGITILYYHFYIKDNKLDL